MTFATDPMQNVTLVYGPNGGGKTTLLNVFTWVLYGTFTEDLERPEELIHSDTWALAAEGTTLQVRGVLRFAHGESVYEVERRLTAVKETPEQRVNNPRGELRVLVTDERGSTTEPRNPSDLIDRILPEQLSKFFFFNGERIENLTRHSAYEQLADATKTLLGLEVISRAIGHLPNAEKAFREELGKLSSSEAQALERDVAQHEQSMVQIRERLATEGNNLSALEDRREAVARELTANQSSRVLQEKRNAAEKSRKDAEARQDAAKQRMREVISRDGFLPFTVTLASTVRERFSDLEARGELPAPIKGPFILELLERGTCICGSPVHVGSPTRTRLEAFLKTAGSPELESLWTRLDGTARRLPDECVSFHATLDHLLKDRDGAARIRREAIELESEVSKELQAGEDVDVQALEDRHGTLLDEISACNQRLGRLQSDLKREQAEHAEAQKAFESASKDDARSNELKECLRIAREGVETLRAIQAVLSEAVRQQLNERIQETYDRVSVRPRIPELSSDFELRLWEIGPDGHRRRAANSTSENTILALSFVGGLVSLARDLEENRLDDPALKRLTEGTGGVYPVVVDAAFGSLDETYKVEVARALPRLASQLLIFVSKAQAHDTVDELAAQVGRRWIIVSHVAKADRDEEISIDGVEHPYRRVCSSGEEHADLVELS